MNEEVALEKFNEAAQGGLITAQAKITGSSLFEIADGARGQSNLDKMLAPLEASGRFHHQSRVQVQSRYGKAGWAEGFARGPLFQEETPGDQRSVFGFGCGVLRLTPRD